MKVLWAILCEGAITDRESNNVSLFNIIEELGVPAQAPEGLGDLGLPPGVFPGTFTLVILCTRANLDTPEMAHGRIRLVAPDNTELLSLDFEMDLFEFLSGRLIINMPGLPISSEGQYLFKIAGKSQDSDWEEMFELPLTVSIQTQDPP